MFRVLAFVALSFALSSCGSESEATSDTESPSEGDLASPSQIAYQLEERDLFPEGIAYDPVTERFFLGSLRKSKIISVDLEGVVDTLLAREELGQGGVLGLKVDAERRILWANYHQDGSQLGADTSAPYRTGIHKIDLETGDLIRSYSIEKEDENFLLNDIALAEDGTVFMTSYSGGTLYTIPAETDELEVFLPMPEGLFTNGITMGPDGRFLFVAGNFEVYRVEIETREVIRLTVPEGGVTGSGDGLYFCDGSLVIIATGGQGRRDYQVARLHLSDDLTAIDEIQILDRENPLYAFPTTGALVDGWLYYIATAQFDRVDSEGTVAPWEELSDIVILRVEVAGSE